MVGKNRNGVVIAVLVLLVVLLGALVLYAFVVKPAISGYAIKAQNQGVNATINYMLAQLQQKGYVSIPVGNQTLSLVLPQSCSQIVQQEQAKNSSK